MVLQWYPVHEISFVCFFLVPVLLLTFLYVSMVVVIKTATKASIRSTFSSHLSFAINNKWVDVYSDPLKVKFKKIPKTEKKHIHVRKSIQRGSDCPAKDNRKQIVRMLGRSL